MSEHYTIGELAERADVTPRTIRYYTSEGLLPAPKTSGKYARYNQDHLERLQLIARLKTAYLPLHEIRDRVSMLSAEEVRAMLREATDAAPRRLAETSSAADYITSVIARQHMPPQGSIQADKPAMLASFVAPPTKHKELHALHPPAPALSTPDESSESWRRIALAPGVELHVREQHERRADEQIQALLVHARKLFNNE